MARIKGAMMTRKRRNKTLKLAKGYFGAKSKHFKMAKQAVMKSGNYACWKKAEEERIPSALDHQNFCCMQAEWYQLFSVHERLQEGWHYPESEDAV